MSTGSVLSDIEPLDVHLLMITRLNTAQFKSFTNNKRYVRDVYLVKLNE